MAPVNDMCPIPKALLRINAVLSMPLFLFLCLSLLTLPQIAAHAPGGGLFVGRGCGAGAPLRETGRAPLARRLCAAARADPRASRLPRLGRRLGRARKFPSRNFPLSSREELPGKFLGSFEAFHDIWKLPAVWPRMCTWHVENFQISWLQVKSN